MPSSTTSSERAAQLARVLLVDDNEAILVRVSAVLSADCAIVGTVKSGPAALEAARTLRPDVIVLDISMPGMTGLEVATCLRKEGSTAALVFLTVHDDEEFMLAAKAAGGIGYVLKSRLASDVLPAVRGAWAGRPFLSPRSNR
jgi:DNA-binding NarL/FixJ family response regulator